MSDGGWTQPVYRRRWNLDGTIVCELPTQWVDPTGGFAGQVARGPDPTPATQGFLAAGNAVWWTMRDGRIETALRAGGWEQW